MRDLFLREPPLLPPFLKEDRGGLDNNVISPNPSLKGGDEVAPTGTRHLPASCTNYDYYGRPYYHCGGVYYQPVYDGPKVVYVVVEKP